MDVIEKICIKTLAQDVLQKMKSWWG